MANHQTERRKRERYTSDTLTLKTENQKLLKSTNDFTSFCDLENTQSLLRSDSLLSKTYRYFYGQGSLLSHRLRKWRHP
ncbi:hypothetical protein MKW98_000795 [Papaver atlanticum]|uniref:Uncharacterized protein n=1 Tax=Papaver atlanticum TaxID=357466 RepID=A0AAD4SE30_9MAGN|nr:hypothetical protein MKW98_000795 [Papaver atlanticum]